MIIAFDISHIRRRRAGLGRFSTLILRGLLGAGKEHTYILHGWGRDLDHETLATFLQDNVRLSIAAVPGTIKRMYWNFLRVPNLQRLIGEFDVFHGAEPLLPPLGRKRSIITVHDLTYKKFPEFFNPWNARKWDYLYRRSMGQADRIIVPSESTRNDLLQTVSVPEEKIHVIPPPINPIFTSICSPETATRLSHSPPIPGEYILFVGTIEPRKNIQGLVRAFEGLLSTSTRPLWLVIAGGFGWSYDDILRTITASKAAKNIILTGYVDDSTLVELYQAAMMFVFPSFYEGHGFPVVEAMASGVPVITSNNSSLKDLGRNAALLVNPDNSNEIREAMARLYYDESLRAQLADAGKKRAEEFSVEKTVNRILGLYASLD